MFPAVLCGACADPESFVRGCPNLIMYFFVDGGIRGSKYCYKWAIIGPPAKRDFNGVSLEGRWWPNIEYWLVSFVIFQGIRTSIAQKPYIFEIFSGGSGPPVPPFWIRACERRYSHHILHVCQSFKAINYTLFHILPILALTRT